LGIPDSHAALGPPDPRWPRYTTLAFPSYRHVPGRTPHPRRHPTGHSFGRPEMSVVVFREDEWRKSSVYQFGIDLYNYGYWWECHEIFEAFWRAAGDGTPAGQCFRGLIQIAAGNLKRQVGARQPALNLYQAGMSRLTVLGRRYMGIDLPQFIEKVRAYAEGRTDRPALIRLGDGGGA